MKLKFPTPATMAFCVVAALFVWLCSLAGCSSAPIIKVDAMVPCDDGMASTLLLDPCAGHVQLAASAVFQDGLKAKKDTDANLDICAAKTAALQKAMKDCHDAVVNHNALIQSLTKP